MIDVSRSPLLLSAAYRRGKRHNMKKAISVRLSDEAMNKCEQAQKEGYSRTEFIDQAIRGIPYYDRDYAQKILPHFCAIAESVSQIHGNEYVKKTMREELDAVCQFLRSHPEHI